MNKKILIVYFIVAKLNHIFEELLFSKFLLRQKYWGIKQVAISLNLINLTM